MRVPCALLARPPQVDRLVGCMVQAAKLAASEVPLCAVIHAVLPPSTHGGDGGAAGGKGASLGAQAGLGGRLQGIESTGGAYFLLQQPVPHELLLPQVGWAAGRKELQCMARRAQEERTHAAICLHSFDCPGLPSVRAG